MFVGYMCRKTEILFVCATANYFNLFKFAKILNYGKESSRFIEMWLSKGFYVINVSDLCLTVKIAVTY